MAIDTTLLQFLLQGGFAALFIYLFKDTRDEAKRREIETKAREDKLLGIVMEAREERIKLVGIIENFSEKFQSISLALDKINATLDRQE